MKFLFSFFKKYEYSTTQQNTLPLTLNEKNRIRAKREEEESSSLQRKQKFEEQQKDQRYVSHVATQYASWVEEFQYQIHKGSDDSKFEIIDGELFGVFCLGEYTFKATTKLGTVNRHLTATKSAITIENEYMDSPTYFIANIVRNSKLESTSHPDSFAKMLLIAVKDEMSLIHMRIKEHDRAERKRIKREMLERNRQRNLAKRKSFVLKPKSECVALR